MKPVSTGTGLCALAGAVLLYPLLHRAAPQAGALNAASAESVSGATQSWLPQTPPPLMPTRPSLPPMGGGGMRPDGGVAMQAVGDGQCVFGEPLDWFTEVHVLPSCSYTATLFEYWLQGASDLDGDGRNDHLVIINQVTSTDGGAYCDSVTCLEYGGQVYQFDGYFLRAGNGFPSTFPHEVGVYRYSFAHNNGTPTVTYQSVLSGTVVNAAVCAVAPCQDPALTFDVNPRQLHDWDGDGDLDLLADVRWFVAGQVGGGSAMVVIENTVKTNPPLAADINEDGVIDGKDLAMVLSAWTP